MVSIRKSLVGGMLLTLVFFPMAYAELGSKTDTQALFPIETEPAVPGDQTVPLAEVRVDEKGISLHFQDFPLGEVLQNVGDRTGIRFKLPEDLALKPVSISVQAADWKTAVSKLIKGYSRTEVWTADLNTSRIWLFGDISGEDEETQVASVASVSLGRAVASLPPVRPSQLGMMGGAAPPAPSIAVVTGETSLQILEALPQYLLKDPGVLSHMKASGREFSPKFMARHGQMIDGADANAPLSARTINDPNFKRYLESISEPSTKFGT